MSCFKCLAPSRVSEVRCVASIVLNDTRDAPELLEKSKAIVAETRKEKGCIYYAFKIRVRSTTRPSHLGQRRPRGKFRAG